ncbi:Peptidoglycan/LPS O-acetylase OafA/YrhL, contains acyltransferase and SGNH-hydrolase domains [Geodermatophilus nigrescens]|uniref:Peptidoglycan/LPS O-acetylase OafA/YrhL, contains acyltransferase and SGNH-hydrolase domains n=1 Tax=Geodermatophilus nigrescens TaxID=1070870 RepID=A0A1M5D3X1_9ACTN|nr:Peptidoglycan/LPS O-acetylase OafA/YrhL, contains acyltransferase and SGNH-hydrolase domains [Geodermatophilus nigrescens]
MDVPAEARSGDPAPVRSRLDSLTGLRFFAALAVFALHSLSFGQHTWAIAVFTAGTTGVSFFFIVSGFVMSWTARPGDTARAFYQRRFARIYPAYAVAWALSIAFIVVDGRRPAAVDLLPLTLIQSWVPSEAVYWAANAVFWTLSCEAFFYLVFPVLHRFVARWRSSRLAIALAVALLTIEVVAVIGFLVGDGPISRWFVTVFPVTRLLEFFVGMLLGTLAVRGVRWRPPAPAVLALVAVAFLAANHVPQSFRDVAVTAVPFALLVWTAAQWDITQRRSLLRWRPVVLLGAWSYAFYLVHTLAMRAAFEVLDRAGWEKESLQGGPLLVAVLGALLLALLAAYALHRVVEVPMERLLRPRAAARR